ncbi:hypothetical protein D0Z00_003411 [Geotrichum galactomycetum]|uniref:Uncharacterized protein n=1 Tax=Geotrichum galactomycetum TaxID=27317 RepID=A0ACB6V1C5_9ASCO|nr:hypothetical protein D0Z00_003411 [Geotrichum candidum]
MASESSKRTLGGGDELNTIDVYIRMNDDPERDYCFNVDRSAPVAKLHDIFTTLPMALSPSYFYERLPVGFKISTHPGFLTSEGALLFARDAADPGPYLKPVDQNEEIGKVAWEGQLFVPVWRPHTRRILVMASILLGWLYLDLPQYITPTPGINPTLLISRVFERVLPAGAVSADAVESLGGNDGGSPITQWMFFFVHVIKCAIIALVFYAGLINPLTTNPFKARFAAKNKAAELTPEKLLAIGWTGTHRATPAQWRDDNRKHQIDRVGGVGKAHTMGILEQLRFAGVYLGPGEGFNTSPQENNLPGKPNMVDDDKPQEKFLLSDEYYKLLLQDISQKLHDDTRSDREKTALLKSFRASGPIFGPEELQALYIIRKALGHGIDGKQ